MAGPSADRPFSRGIALMNLTAWTPAQRGDLLRALTTRRPGLTGPAEQSECDSLMDLIREAGDCGGEGPAALFTGRVPVPGERVQARAECDEILSAAGQRTSPGIVIAVRGTGAEASVIVALDSGHSVPYRPGELDVLTSKDSRRAGLYKLSKARLIALYRAGVRTPAGRTVRYGGGMHPIEAWSKADVIASIMTAEFPVPDVKP